MNNKRNSLASSILIFLERYHLGFVILLILAFLVIGIGTLGYYGISWDEGLGNFFFGERYLFYLITFEEKYLDFNADLAGLQDLPLHLFQSPFKNYPYEFPALADILSAASMHFFGYQLGWMDPVDAFHLITVILSAVFLLLLYQFTARRTSPFIAWVGILFLATFPRFWGDMHFNPKDVPVTAFIAFVIMAYFIWYENPKIKTAILTGVLFGCGLAIKANTAFTPLILMLGIWPLSLNMETLRTNLGHFTRNWIHYVLMALTSLGVYFLSWPYLYADPFRVKAHFDYITSQGGRTGDLTFSLNPLLQVMTTMPEIMLLFLVTGLVFLIFRLRKNQDPILRLWLLWMIIPIARISLPGMVNFDGIRHFLEFLPAAAMIAAYGVDQTIRLFSYNTSFRKIALAAGFFLALAANIFWINTRYHPYQHLHYNSLVGGLTGAAKTFGIHEATDYWAVSYRQGMNWLKNNTSGDVYLYVPVADWLVRLPQRIWLHSGVSIIERDSAGDLLLNNSPFYALFINHPGYFDDIAWYCVENLTPEYQIIVDGQPILYIFHVQNEVDLK